MSGFIIPEKILITVQSREVAPTIVFEKTKWNDDGWDRTQRSGHTGLNCNPTLTITEMLESL